MKTLLLICALGVPRPDCTIDTAVTAIRAPDTSSPASCAFVGQAYLADTIFADYLQDGHYLKILCRRPTSKISP